MPLAVGAEELATSSTYVPSPYSPGWEVWIGFAAGVIPFIIGGYEFTKRIVSFIFSSLVDHAEGTIAVIQWGLHIAVVHPAMIPDHHWGSDMISKVPLHASLPFAKVACL